MQSKNGEPLYIVRNPQSTRSDSVEHLVLDPLREAKRDFITYAPPSPDFETNVADMQQEIPAGARVISATGDGTAAQLVNANLRGGMDWTIGFAPGGNFNDLHSAHTGETSILDLVDEDAPTVDVRPLTIERDGEYWRHSAAYFSLGWTALATSEFSRPEVRASMKNSNHKQRLQRSLVHVARNYFQHSRKTLPHFTVNSMTRHRHSTDILAVVNPRVARLLQTDQDYASHLDFGARHDINVTSPRMSSLLFQGVFAGRTPLDRRNALQIAFEETVRLPAQTEGEFEYLDAQNIFVYKNPADVLRVIHTTGKRSSSLAHAA